MSKPYENLKGNIYYILFKEVSNLISPKGKKGTLS